MDEIKIEWPSENAEVNAVTELSAEDRQMVADLIEKTDIMDSGAIIAYGASPQNKIAAFSDSVLKNIRTRETGAAGKLLSDLVVEIKNFDATGEQKTGFLSIFSSVSKSIDKMRANYSRVETNVDKITDALEEHRRQLMKDIATYDALFESNFNYFKELNLYIYAGKEKIEHTDEQLLPALRAKAEASGDQLDIQRFNDAQNALNRFEKKIHDLELSRMISLQMAPQIRLIQNNDAQLVDKIQSSIVNSIPLWKNQIVISMGLANAKAALETQRRVTDMTDDLLRKNSEMLKQGSLEVAKESERGIVSIETIQKTNRDLIETITGVLEIQKQGGLQRQSAEVELNRIENELKQTLIAAKNS